MQNPFSSENPRPDIARVQPLTDLEQHFVDGHKLFCEKYDIPVFQNISQEDTQINKISGWPADTESADKAIWALLDEFAKYPDAYIAGCLIRKIVFLRSMKHDKVPIDGLMGRDGTLYVVVHPDHMPVTRQTFHHELEHRANALFADDNKEQTVFVKQGKKLRRTTFTDMYWHNINKRHSLYYVDDQWEEMTDNKGFACIYGAESMDEDQATIVQQLMTDPTDLYTQCASDPALSEKVALMKKELKRRLEQLRQQAENNVDDTYIAKICQGQAI